MVFVHVLLSRWLTPRCIRIATPIEDPTNNHDGSSVVDKEDESDPSRYRYLKPDLEHRAGTAAVQVPGGFRGRAGGPREEERHDAVNASESAGITATEASESVVTAMVARDASLGV